MVYIENDGQAIAGTDYWESEMNARGLIAISMNAGAFRILVPDSMAPQVADMQTARDIVVRTGRWLNRRFGRG